MTVCAIHFVNNTVVSEEFGSFEEAKENFEYDLSKAFDDGEIEIDPDEIKDLWDLEEAVNELASVKGWLNHTYSFEYV